MKDFLIQFGKASQKISVITTKVGGIPDLVNENEVTFIKKRM